MWYNRYIIKKTSRYIKLGKMQRTKGANYERKIAKQLTAWAGDKDVTFNRTVGSGSFASTHRGVDQWVGDIVAPIDANFPFSIELKHHETVNLECAFNSSSEFPQFWEQCIGDGLRADLIPMLIMHRNNSLDFVVVPHSIQFLVPFKKAHAKWMSTEVKIVNKTLNKTFYFDVDIVDLKELTSVYTYKELTEKAPTMFKKWKDIASTHRSLASFK